MEITRMRAAQGLATFAIVRALGTIGPFLVMPAKAGIQAQMESSPSTGYTISA